MKPLQELRINQYSIYVSVTLKKDTLARNDSSFILWYDRLWQEEKWKVTVLRIEGARSSYDLHSVSFVSHCISN